MRIGCFAAGQFEYIRRCPACRFDAEHIRIGSADVPPEVREGLCR
jgi:hypothetical protein